MKINDILEDEDIEECIDGSSNIDMIREIIDKSQKDNLLDTGGFADWFAYGVEGYIDAEYESDEWHEAWYNNHEWGRSIAENINELITEKWTN